jgi:hypothetical protein
MFKKTNCKPFKTFEILVQAYNDLILWSISASNKLTTHDLQIFISICPIGQIDNFYDGIKIDKKIPIQIDFFKNWAGN